MSNPVIAFLGDLHISHSGHSFEKFQKQMKFFEEQFFPYILENKIKFVAQLGDIFHDRSRADWLILNEFKRRFFQWFDDNDVELHILVGNHDCVYKNTVEENSLTETTKSFSNVKIYSTPTKVEYSPYTIGFNPWIVDNKIPNLTKKVDICLGHFNVFEMPMMKGIYSKDGLKHSAFKDYKLTLSGHFHIRSVKDNFHMIGSPFQLNWGDYNEPRGFATIDNSFNLEYHQNQVNPQYVKLYYDNDQISVLGLYPYTDTPTLITKEESLQIAKENYCRLFTRVVEDQSKLDNYLSSLIQVSLDDSKIECINLNDVLESYDDEEFNTAFDDNESTINQIISCINGMTFDAAYDKDMLTDLIKKEYKEAHQEVLGVEE